MSATLSNESYQLPAGLLALVVHSAFFALLYFGFTWQTRPVETMSVELWQSLPEAPPLVPIVVEAVQPTPPLVPIIAEAVQPAPPDAPLIAEAVQPPQPEKIIKPDITLPDKKVKVTVEPKPEKKKPVPSSPEQVQGEAVKIQAATQNLAEQKQAESDQRERIEAEQAAQAEQDSADQEARDKAAQNAAMDSLVNEYKAKIIAKIRRNIVKPPDVRDDARAEFSVTLLPGGTVLSANLRKSSGNPAYDNAVERAILKSQPLPLPADVSMFNKFRELKLVFKPAE